LPPIVVSVPLRVILKTVPSELHRHIERVAALRRTLPPGGIVPEDYAFESPNGAVRLSRLFGDKDTIVIYRMMFGPQR
jgi:predicted dithiol-disulfide oxidoreductase (DUF899 family)